MKQVGITVADAWASTVAEMPLEIEDGTSMASLMASMPDANPAAVITVWGRRVERSYVLREGDRVEILKPLLADPKEARRQRAKGARR